MARKPGRKANYVTFGTTTIDGLSLDKGNKSYYTYYTEDNTQKRKKKYFGRDLHVAINKFNKFQKQFKNRDHIHEKESIINLIKNDSPPYKVKREIENYIKRAFRYNKAVTVSAFSKYIPEELRGKAYYKIYQYLFKTHPNLIAELYQVLQNYAKDKSVNISIFNEIELPDVNYIMPDNVFWSRVRKEILTNPVKVSQLTGIEEIAYLRNLPSPEKSLTLDEISNIYINRKAKPLSAKMKRDSGNWWREFKKIIAKDDIRSITQDDINNYHDTIHDNAHNNNYSPTWIKHRFNTVKTILNYALKKVSNKTDIRIVLDYCELFEYPERNHFKPEPIDKDDFLKMYNAADVRWKAILLLSLNCGFYPKDIHDLKKDDIDLKKKELRMLRQKTKILRVACLWSRTVKAIKEYQKKHPHNSDYLFVSNHKSRYRPQSIRNYFRDLQRRANASNNAKFEHLRDAAQSIPAANNCTLDSIRYLLGHKVAGVTDNYLERQPKMTKNACRELEKHYFSKN